jgi:hypothetical protein
VTGRAPTGLDGGGTAAPRGGAIQNAGGHVVVVTGDVDASGRAGVAGEAAQGGAGLRGVTTEDEDVGGGVTLDGAADGAAALGGGGGRHAAGVDGHEVRGLAGAGRGRTDPTRPQPPQKGGQGLGLVLVDLAADGGDGKAHRIGPPTPRQGGHYA